MDKLQEIIEESLIDGEGIIVHKENFQWIVSRIERQQKEIDQLKKELTSARRMLKVFVTNEELSKRY